MRTLTALATLAAAQRVWTLCKGPQFRPPTAAEQANEVEAGNEMCCTPELQFEELCCFDFANAVQKMTRCGVIELAAAQHTTAAGAVLMQDDASDANAPIITVCTSSSPVGLVSNIANGATAMSQAGSAAILPTECVKREFLVHEVTGDTSLGIPPGQAVLDERIKFLMEQQVPASAIPVCVEAVPTCPSGLPPASASPEYVAARYVASSGVATLANTTRAPMLRKPRPALLVQSRNWGGALMTSGSFTMMASSDLA